MSPSKNKDDFEKFYKLIKSREYTTAMLQEFLFYNRKCDTVFDKINDFYKIIEKNDSNHFEKKTDNIYM